MPWMIHKSMAYTDRHSGKSEPLWHAESAFQLRDLAGVPFHPGAVSCVFAFLPLAAFQVRRNRRKSCCPWRSR